MTNIKIRRTRPGHWRQSIPTELDPVSMTKQEFKDDCDVKSVMQRWAQTGVLDHTRVSPPTYGDTTLTPASYQEALEISRLVENEFNALDPETRAEYDNDPAAYLEHLEQQAHEREIEPEPEAPPTADSAIPTPEELIDPEPTGEPANSSHPNERPTPAAVRDQSST